MASTFTTSLRFTLQATGEGLNTWGNILNSGCFSLIDTAIAGRYSTTAATVLLTTNQGSSDQARNAILDVTGGTGTTFTAPAVSKLYFVRNASSGDTIVTTSGASTYATVKAGERVPVVGDGTNFYRFRLLDMGGDRLSNLGTPTSNNDAVTKAYADGLAFASTDIPGINSGTTYFSVSNDGAAALWKRTLPVSSGSTTGQVLKSTGVDGYPEDTSQWAWDGYQGTVDKSGSYTVALTDRGKTISCTSTFTLSLTAAATLGDKFYCKIVNAGTGLITIDPNSTETITFPGQLAKTTIVLVPGEGIALEGNGSNFTATVCQQAGLVLYAYEQTAPSYSSSTWATRLVATLDTNDLGVTYSTGTLQNVPPGRYEAVFTAAGAGVDGFASRLYNSTAAAAIMYGDTGSAENYGSGVYITGWSSGNNEFDLSASSNLVLQTYATTSAVGAQWGSTLSMPGGVGATNRTAELRLFRVGP